MSSENIYQCQHCGIELSTDNYRKFAAHSGWCDKNPNTEKRRNKIKFAYEINRESLICSIKLAHENGSYDEANKNKKEPLIQLNQKLNYQKKLEILITKEYVKDRINLSIKEGENLFLILHGKMHLRFA